MSLPPPDIFEPKTVEAKEFATDKLVEKMSVIENEKFSNYLTDLFVKVMKQPEIAYHIHQIETVGKYDVPAKTTFTQLFTDTFVSMFNQDINSGDKIPTMENITKSDLFKINPDAIKEDLLLKNMTVKHVDDKGFLMGVEHTRTLYINFNWLMYSSLDCFLMDLRHETTHIIDIFSPRLGSLGEEVALESRRNYIPTGKYYDKNPLEQNANTERAKYAAAIRQTISEIKTRLVPLKAPENNNTAFAMYRTLDEKRS